MTAGTDFDIAIAQPGTARLMVAARARLSSSALRGLLAVIDQAVVSGTSFLTSVIVGRACGPQELGDYTLAFSAYVIACCVLRALISMPYTVYSQRLRGDDERAYAGSTLAHFALFCMLWGLALGALSGSFALGYGQPALAPLMGIMALSFPLAFLVEFARRFALTKLQMTTVLLLDTTLSALQLGGLLLLAWMGWLSAVGAYVAVGVGAAVAGLTWLAASRPMFLIRRAQLTADFVQNWRCGRWLLFSSLSLAARASAVIWLVALELDTTLTGIFVACDTLVRLSSPIPIAAANILFPSAARAYAEGDVQAVRRLVYRCAGLVSAATLPFFAVFVFGGGTVLAMFYGDKFQGYGMVVGLLAVSAMTDALDTGAANGLFAIDRPNVHFVALALGTVTMLVMAGVMVTQWGIVGAAVGTLIGRTLTTTVQWLAFFRLTRCLVPQVSP